MSDKSHFVVAVIIGITIPCIIGGLYLRNIIKEKNDNIEHTGKPLIINGETELLDVPLKFSQEKTDERSIMDFEVSYIGDSSEVRYSLNLSNISYSQNIDPIDIIWSLEDIDDSKILKRGTILELSNNRTILSNRRITPGDIHKYELTFYLSKVNVEYSSGNLSVNLSTS